MRCLRVAAMLLALCAALLPAGAVRADEACVPSGPVSLMILQSGQKVRELAAALGGQVVVADANTVILADGRVITADPEAAGQALNRLGWGARPIQVVVSFPKRRARPRGFG